jgi:hypothetical protein
MDGGVPERNAAAELQGELHTLERLEIVSDDDGAGVRVSKHLEGVRAS